MKRRFPIALRIALFFSTMIIVLFCLFMAVVTFELRTSLQQLNLRQFTGVASARADQLTETLEKIDSLLFAYSKLPPMVNGDTKQIESLLMGAVQVFPTEMAGMFYADLTGKTTMSSGNTVNVSDRDYFKAIVKDTQSTYISSPVMSKSLQVPIVVMARAVYTAEGKIRGLMGAQILLDKLSIIATSIKVGHTGYGWITDGEGTVIANPDPKLVMKLKLGEAAKSGYQDLESLNQSFKTGFIGAGTWKQPDGTEMASYFAAIKRSPGWHLILSLPASEVNETADGILKILSVFLLGGLVISLFLSLLLARAVSKPLKIAAQKFRLLAEGDADLTVQIPLKRNDEIGDLVQDFNAFIAKLHQIVSNVKTAQTQLRTMGDELKASAQNSASAVQQIAGQTTKVGQLIQKQGSSISESSAAVEEITKNIEFLDKLIGNQANEISQASAAIEEMIGNISSISSSVGKMSGEFSELTVEAKEGQNRMETTLKGIELVSERSVSLIEANKVISGIAARTNLLAMNAAIEAAHAGEYGRGFSVVASEIRNLAENSAQQSRAIAKEISEVRATMEQMVVTAKITGDSFAQVSRRVAGIEVLTREISQAMTEQNQASTQVLEALRGIKDGTFQVQNGSREMNTGNIMILKEMENLRESSQAIHSGMGEVTDGTAHIHTAAQRVLEIATETQETIESVEDSVGRFKI